MEKLRTYLKELQGRGDVFYCANDGDYKDLNVDRMLDVEILEIRHLFLGDLELTTLDPVITQLTNLRALQLQNNHLKVIPDLSPLKNLKKLVFPCNRVERIEGLPKGIKYIEGEFNEFQVFPIDITQFPNISTFMIQQPSLIELTAKELVYMYDRDHTLLDGVLLNEDRFKIIKK